MRTPISRASGRALVLRIALALTRLPLGTPERPLTEVSRAIASDARLRWGWRTSLLLFAVGVGTTVLCPLLFLFGPPIGGPPTLNNNTDHHSSPRPLGIVTRHRARTPRGTAVRFCTARPR